MLFNKIGFIGLGLMGFPMAKNLIAAGYEVHITKHSDSKASFDRINELIALGGKNESNIIELVKGVDIIISILPADKEVRDVYLNKEVLNAIQKDTIILDMTSCSASTIIDVERYYSEKGIRVLDAPVSGGVGGAQKGTLTIFGAGDKDTFDKVEDVLKCLGTNIYYIGSLGKGKVLKSINNMMSSINTLATIEGFQIARKHGIDFDIMHEVIKTSSGNSIAFEMKGHKIYNKDYEPGFKLNLMRKDIKIALDSIEESSLPIAQLTYDMFLKATEYDQLDFTSISRLYNSED